MRTLFGLVAALMLFLGATVALAAEDAVPPAKKPHRGLPLMWEKVPPEYREDFPSPYGFTLHYNYQKQTLVFGDANITANGMPIPPALAQVESITEASDTIVTRLDAWLLPFLNTYVHVSGFTGVTNNINVTSAVPLPLPVPDRVSYNGTNYGIGFTGVYGFKSFFITYDWNWTWTRQDLVDNIGLTTEQGPRVGRRMKDWSVYVGGTKQNITGHRTGSITLSDGTLVEYDLRAIPRRNWNWVLGLERDPSKNWNLIMEMGFGDRRTFMFSSGYRF